MKVIRFRENGKVKPGVIMSGGCYDASSFGEDYTEQFFESDGLNKLQQFVDIKKISCNGWGKIYY